MRRFSIPVWVAVLAMGPASSEVGGVAAVVQSKLTTCSVYRHATLVAVAVRRQHHDTRRT